jgi:hypothetical protein
MASKVAKVANKTKNRAEIDADFESIEKVRGPIFFTLLG